jgi:acetyltransferase
MRKFFHPKSLAIVGVSASPGNLGRNIYHNMKTFGYKGPLYLVSPRGGEYKGNKIYTSIGDLPEPPELAVILTPAATVPGLVAACGEKGIKNLVIESGGFTELDQSKADLENQILKAAQKYGIRFIGPNCIGVICTQSGVAAPFPVLARPAPPGGVSIVAQSGGVGLTYLHNCAQAGIGISKFASVGNKLNVNERDLLAYLIEDPETKVILLYLESIVAGREIADLIASCPKPVLVHKSNISPKSNAIAQSHTAALANDDSVVEAALKQAGAIRAHTVTECIDILKGLTMPRAKGKRMVVISRSGGHAVVAADAVSRKGLELPPLPREFLDKIKEHVRASVIKLQNPLDLGDLFDFKVNITILEEALALDATDAVVVIHGYRGKAEAKDSRDFIKKAGELCREYDKPVGLCLLVEPDELAKVKEISSLPLFQAPEETVNALAHCRIPDPLPELELPPQADAPDWGRIRRTLGAAQPDGSLELPESLILAASSGIPVAPFMVALNPDEAGFIARELGFPVVIKAVGVSHKTEHKGVVLNLRTQEEVVSEASRMFESLKLKRLVVMSQIPGETEVIVGAKNDPSFGPLVLLGLGGITAEALKDVSLGLAPVSPGQAGYMMDTLKGVVLLNGFRGKPAINRAALAHVVCRASELAAELPEIAELDLNPVITGPGGSVAVDARVVVRKQN